MKGYTHIYTGDGKGKTTAALGLLLRAVGAGLRVYFGQFLKDGKSSEIIALKKRFPEVVVASFGSGRLLRAKPSAQDIVSARDGMTRLHQSLTSGRYDVVIADEIHVAVSMGMLGVEDVLALIRGKPCNVELVLTGRSADKRLYKVADLVTEARCIKHYWCKGVGARKGIEK
jgi:cob(I)alamin adenosyltransferase